MSKTIIDFAIQLKAIYKTRHKYTNHILLIAFMHIIQLYNKLECPLLLALYKTKIENIMLA